MITHIITDRSLTVVGPDLQPRTVASNHPSYEKVIEAINDNNEAEVYRLMNLPNAIVQMTQGEVTVADNVLYLRGRRMDTYLTRRILRFFEEGKGTLAQPLMAFLERVDQNPSRRAVQGLYEWCEKGGLPITSDGFILAWKIVRDDYLDVRTGEFDNSIGNVVEMPRNEVDEDPDRTCSHGLHFCSTEYLPSYGGYSNDRRVMVVKIDPADVVAFPRDYNTSKGRTWRYEVIGEVPAEKAREYFPHLVSDYSSDNGFRDGDIEVYEDEIYRTRDGRHVVITGWNPEDDTGYEFKGLIVETGAKDSWTENGLYTVTESEHPLDLVECAPLPEIEVGKTYLDAEGSPVEIVLFDGFNDWFADGNERYYASQGSAIDSCQPDLICEKPAEKPKKGGFLNWLFG